MIRFWFASLANRAVALVVVFVLVTAVVVASIGAVLSRAELEQQAHTQVEAIAEMVAGELDQKLALRRDVLSQIASDIPASEVLLRNRSRVLLRQQAPMLKLFDGLFIIDAQGAMLAANPLDYLIPDFDASGYSYFKEVSSTLVPVISEPFVTHLDERPGVMIAAPLFDHRNRFTGMIGGLILLKGDNFMRDFTEIRVGERGYLRLITRDGVLLADGRDGRVLLPVEAHSRSLARALEGFEGTLHERSAEQPGAITAYEQMAQVPWFVEVVWPESDAFASVNRMRDAFSWTLLSVLVVLAPLAFWFFHRLLRPLRDLSLQIYQRHTGERQMPVSEIGGGKSECGAGFQPGSSRAR